MTTLQRAELKAGPFRKLLDHIVSKHVTPKHTIDKLMSLKHIENICEEARIFCKLSAEGRPTIYISYDVSTWIVVEANRLGFPTRVERVNIYDDFTEYESCRVRELSAADPDGRTSEALNLN